MNNTSIHKVPTQASILLLLAQIETASCSLRSLDLLQSSAIHRKTCMCTPCRFSDLVQLLHVLPAADTGRASHKLLQRRHVLVLSKKLLSFAACGN